MAAQRVADQRGSQANEDPRSQDDFERVACQRHRLGVAGDNLERDDEVARQMGGVLSESTPDQQERSAKPAQRPESMATRPAHQQAKKNRAYAADRVNQQRELDE